jgi:chromosome segregation ATPase
VIVFGDALSALPEQLVERGARLVYVYDSDPTRVAEATQRASSASVSFAPLEQAGSLARDGGFELGIIEDVGAGGPQAARQLESLARALGRRGVALIATRNPDAQQRLIETASTDTPLGYYPLHELVRAHFSEVRMLGQAPFVGYAIVDFGADSEDEINIDTALVPGGAEQPEWFVALASQNELRAEGFSVIQLPFAGMGQRGPRHAEVERARVAEKRALARITKLEADLAEAGAAGQALPGAGAQSNKAELERLQRELGERDKWLEGLEARAATADQRADEMQVELEHLREEASARQAELERLKSSGGDGARLKTKLEEDKSVLRQELLGLRKQLDDQRKQFDEQRRQFDDRRQHDDSRRSQDDSRRQLDDYRRQLDEQKRQLDELRHQHDDAKRREDDARRQLDEQKKLLEDGRRQVEEQKRSFDEQKKQLDEARRQLDEQRRKHDELKRRHDDELGYKSRSGAELDDMRRNLAEATLRLDEQTAQVVALTRQLSDGAAEPAEEIARLEEQLRERGHEVARLEQALGETERFGKQLIVQLEALKQGPGDASAADVERLSRRNAELEANLESARWTISQLESAAPEATKPAEADANIQRQAVLLEQARPRSS